MEVGVEPRARQSWTRRDLTTLGALALVAAAAIVIGLGGATRVQPIAGLALILAIAYCLSAARHAIDYRTVAWGLTLQGFFAVIVLKTEVGRQVFQQLGSLMTRLLNFTYVGSSFVFGPLGDPAVWPRIIDRRARARKARSTRTSSPSWCCRRSSSSRRCSRCSTTSA